MKIDYTVVRSQRKTLEISVERDRSVVVRAPLDVTDEQIAKAIEKKKFWLYQKINHGRKYNPAPSKEFVSGAAVTFLGHQYQLAVVDHQDSDIVFSDRFYLARKKQSAAQEVFKQWYIAEAKKRLPEMVKNAASAMGVKYQKVLVSDLKVRWASCTPNNNLNFNWRLIKAPLFVIRYIIAHELAHLLESNHTARFWNTVKAQIPEYEKAKQWLADHGDLLEADV